MMDKVAMEVWWAAERTVDKLTAEIERLRAENKQLRADRDAMQSDLDMARGTPR
jgi:outer membrane murein-binding lipoprotein Lpp